MFRCSDGGLLTVDCSFLSLNMGSIIVAKKFNFALDGPQNFLETIITMLQNGVYVKFLEHGKFAISAGFSTVIREVLH